METNNFNLRIGDQVFVAGEGMGEDLNLSKGKHIKESEHNLNPYKKCFKSPTDFSSGDDCSTAYEIKMESTIVQQNNEIITLEEELETKNRNLSDLQDELKRKNILIQEMEETILTQNDSIEQFQNELNKLTKNVEEMKETIRTKENVIQELEESILNQSKTVNALENELKTKNEVLHKMNDDLKKNGALLKEMNNTISSKNNVICILQNDIEIKNENIREIEEVIFRLKARAEEAEGFKIKISDLTNQVKGLEEILRVKDKAIQESNQWHIAIKDEFDAQSAQAQEREENLKYVHNKEIEKLKEEFLEQFKLVGEKQSLLEAFLENQINLLLDRLGELSTKCYGNKKDVETFKKIYNEELKKVKLNVVHFPENVDTDRFINRLEEFNKNLAVCFLHEESIKAELKSKLNELEEVKDELNQCKKMCEQVLSNEKQLFTKLTQTEIELNMTKDERVQLQHRLTQSNSNYEKVTIDFNRDRQELEKKYRQDLESYETDLIILNKSLQELLCNIPSNFESEGTFLGSGDSSLVSLNSDVNSMISNPNIINAQKIVTRCLYELGKLRNEMKRINQESKAMRLAIDLRSKNLEEKNDQLKKLTDEFDLLKSKYSEIENEKKYVENKLRYMVEENTHLSMNIESLNSEIAEMSETIKKYQDEIASLKKVGQSLKEEHCSLSNPLALSPILLEKDRLAAGSDTELVFRADLNTPDISFQSLPASFPRDTIIYTSTPFHGVPFDLEGGGELPRAKIIKTHSDFQVSLLKWMEKCQQLDKENKSLTIKLENLELLNQDLTLGMKCVKEELDVFQEKQKKLEQKLNNYVSLEKQLVTSCNESNMKDYEIKNLMKNLDDLTNENADLFHKNLELEEIYRKHVSKLTEVKHVQNVSAFADSVTNTFNEKVKEIIQLKRDINSLYDDKKSLSLRVEMLLDSNNSYISKLSDLVEKLSSCQQELEKTSNEKLEVLSNNKLLKNEIELLQQRVDYLSALRDNHWCNPSSMQLFEDMHKEVLAMFRNTFEYKLDSRSSSPASKDSQKDSEKLDPLNLPEVLKVLSTQLRDEKIDFEQKATEFQKIIQSLQERNLLNDDWLLKIDKMLRHILEEMKYHRDQYCRIEEALRSTGKFHDQLQKQNDELRIKDHELGGIQKKLDEEKIKSKKNEAHLKMIGHDIAEKDELIKALVDQRDKLEADNLALKKAVCDMELKLQANFKSIEYNKKLEELRKSKQEIEEKIQSLEKSENEYDDKDALEKGLQEAEEVYHKAVDEVKAFLQAEMSSRVANIQEEHKEQVEQLQRVISEQAIRIGFLLKKNSLNLKGSEESETDIFFINEDPIRKQFELAVYALQQLHQEELQLLRLQVEAEKYNEIYEALHKNRRMLKTSNIHSRQTKDLENANLDKNLIKRLEAVFRQDFFFKLKSFFSDWHSLYSNVVTKIENDLLKCTKDYLEEVKINKDSNAEDLKGNTTDVVNQYAMIIGSAKDFLNNLQAEFSEVNTCLNNVIQLYVDVTSKCLIEIKESHTEISDSLQLIDQLASLKKEKEELENQHKNAIELLHADHKAEEEKIQLVLAEIKKCCENGCDPNTLLKIKEDLEEKHKKELEDLRAYYVQMCANMEKQYSEDVNSLHSRMLSLSSSCSDDIISDQVLLDKGGSGELIGNMMLSEVLPEPALESFSPEQIKLIEELYYKWSEDVKELKRQLENKYTKKIEQLQERLSTFIYNNELDISVRCIKDEVMRDCRHEMENIEKEITSRMLPFHDDIESLKSDNECLSLGRDLWRDENDMAWEQFVVDLMGTLVSNDALNKITKEIALAAIKNIFGIQQQNYTKLLQFMNLVDNTFSLIEIKMKDKENKLLSLQNKLNNFSQTVLKLANRSKLSIEESKARDEIFNNSVQLEKMFEEGYNKDSWPPELAKVCKVFKNKIEKMIFLEREKFNNEIEMIKKNIHKEKEDLEKSFESDLNSRPSIDEFDRLIRERDSLKQMTCTLKSAVSQLVSYLSTCEDELNKTVVDELLKICDDTPRKGSDFSHYENSPRRVHFAPEVGLSDLDESGDLSTVLRLQLDSCLSKLKLEAASLLGITSLQPPPANLNKQIENLRKENEELHHELSELKLRLEKSQDDSLELRDQLFSDPSKENGSTFLQDRAQLLLNNGDRVPPEAVKLLDELAKFGDKLINELQKERMDLEQQIDAADKQLKSTRQFLEEQAVERESERDEYAKEVTNLQSQLKERSKNWTSHERFTSEVEELELQLKEANALLEESEKKRELVDAELKDAIDKVWVLRDIISDLESQLNTKSEKEALLEKKLDELEVELDQQNGTHYAMAQELESLRSQSLDDGYLEQIKQQLHENIKSQFNPTVVRQMKLQIREMEKGLEHRTKELEAHYLGNSNNSLSSPSEEVSLREQLEWKRCKTPEECPSPVALPVEELARLQEKLTRHSRAEEVLIKRLRDQQLVSAKLSSELEEIHADREMLQQKLKKQMAQLAESNNKIDDLRRKVETAQTNANKELVSQLQDLKERYSLAKQTLDSLQNQLAEYKGQLTHAEEIISKQQTEIRNLAHSDHEIVDSLRLELAAVTAERNKLEELLDKYKRDFNLDVVNALLADKNEDIDQLQHTVALLQNQEDEDKHGSCNSKGYRVSFASEVEENTDLSEEMRLRDAPPSNSLDILPENIPVFGNSISPITHDKEDFNEFSQQRNFNLSASIIPASCNESEDNNESMINNLKLELLEKSELISSLENEVQCLKSIEDDLKSTKSELELVLSSVSEDKKFYEGQLESLKERINSKEEEIQKLKKVMFSKDEELIKTTADVQALREISLSLQEKLKEATGLAERENSNILKEELARLTSEIRKRDEELNALRNEFLTCKNDLADEKEFCATLRSSLNIVTKEKLQLEEKIDSLRKENSNLVNALQNAEDNFQHYVTAVRNLKNDLFSQSAAQAFDSNLNSSLSNINLEENEVIKLKQEVMKLLKSNEELKIERSKFLDEVERLKSTIASNDFARKDFTIGQLQEELKELKNVVLATKQEKLEVFANFSSELNKLHKDVNHLQALKQEATEKLKMELSEKQKLQEMYESLKTELNCEKQLKEEQKQKLASRVEKLSFCDIGILDIPPVSYVPGLDALAEKMRKEIKLSATLDNSLLESILPENNEDRLGNRNNTVPKAIMPLDHEVCTSRIRTLEKALMGEMGKAREGKRLLRDKENRCRDLETEKYELKSHIDRLGRLVSNQNDKINQLLAQVESQKERIITLELSVVKEQSSLKQVTNMLEDERNKAREAQHDDITLIETMRQRLQNLMENEIKLKKLVMDERQRSEGLLAQLNSLRAIEKYRSDSDDDNHKNIKKAILNEREKYLALKVEYEKEKRTCEDLREVLARERTALCLQRDHLLKSERLRSQVEKENSTLKQKLNEEHLRREVAESKLLQVQESSDSRFQKQLQALENRNKKSLDTANGIIRELEQEYNDLKRYLQSQQEQDDHWKENIHAPLIQQLNEVNDNLDALVKERVDLKRTVERLNEENSHLHSLVAELRMISGRQGISAGASSVESQLHQVQLRAFEAVVPFMDREVNDLLQRVFTAEHHRKALVFQKKFLLSIVRGHLDAHSEIHLRLLGDFRLRRRTYPNKSFRVIVLAVIASFKLRTLPLKRQIRYINKKEALLQSLQASLRKSTAEAERLAATEPSPRQPAPHSPPSRDRAIQRYR